MKNNINIYQLLLDSGMLNLKIQAYFGGVRFIELCVNRNHKYLGHAWELCG